MTLNISLFTPSGVHQSADFRLVDSNSGHLVDDSSSKFVFIHNFTWQGTITYCGIGRWQDLDTAQWLARWLTNASDKDGSFDQAADLIRQEGDLWLAAMPRDAHGRPHHHTFVLSGYINGTTRVALISNFERLGRPYEVAPITRFRISTSIVRRSRVVINGMQRAVSSYDRALLKSLAKRSEDPIETRRILFIINRRSARSASSSGRISEACWAHSMGPDGSSEGRLYGKVEGPLVPISLLNGVELWQIR